MPTGMQTVQQHKNHYWDLLLLAWLLNFLWCHQFFGSLAQTQLVLWKCPMSLIFPLPSVVTSELEQSQLTLGLYLRKKIAEVNESMKYDFHYIHNLTIFFSFFFACILHLNTDPWLCTLNSVFVFIFVSKFFLRSSKVSWDCSLHAPLLMYKINLYATKTPSPCFDVFSAQLVWHWSISFQIPKSGLPSNFRLKTTSFLAQWCNLASLMAQTRTSGRDAQKPTTSFSSSSIRTVFLRKENVNSLFTFIIVLVSSSWASSDF